MTDRAYLQQLRTPTKNNPLRILLSACLMGINCAYDSSAYGEYPSVLKILQYDTVKFIKFCPEYFSCGTPRALSDIHGGTGFYVIDGKAKVLSGKDWTKGMIKAAVKMLQIAQKKNYRIGHTYGH